MNLNSFDKRILVTGGAGFIGSEVVRYFVKNYPHYLIVNFDALTYAGNLENLKDVEEAGNYIFELGDIRNKAEINRVFNGYKITDVIHLAAESHVDRSIDGPQDFLETNVFGTFNLLDVAREAWSDNYAEHRFHHVSTDEVFGSLSLFGGRFDEKTPYDPHSPYSASKASSDHFVKAYHDTYGLNVTVSNCSNNYGPYQFPEKLVPLAINNLKNGKPIPIYGKGDNIRDWLYVTDHARAIDVIFHKGKSGETYCVGGNHELANLAIVKAIINAYNKVTGTKLKFDECVEYVEDRKGHDKRYAINFNKITTELGWTPKESFSSGIEKTVRWYLENDEWVNGVTNEEYKAYFENHYGKRTEEKTKEE